MRTLIRVWEANPVLASWLVACVVSQTIKICLGVMRDNRFDFRWLVVTGGMPSTHAAGVTALTVAVGYHSGFESPLFAIALAFTLIIVFDAQGVRRSSGRQAQVLNKILEDIYFKRRIQEQQVKELLGHTPIQVLAGMLIGVLTAVFMRRS